MNKDNKIEIYKKKIKEIVESKYTMYITGIVSIILFILSLLTNNCNYIFIAIMAVWIFNMLYGLVNIKKRVIFLIMNFMLFTFVLDRPLINMFNGMGWKAFSVQATQKALIAILITEIFIFIGTRLSEKYFHLSESNKKDDINKGNNNKILRITLIIAVFITGIVSAYVEIAKYIDMKDVDYALNYTDEVIEFSLIIRTLATLFSYCVFAYLATKPNRIQSMILLGLYVLLAIPSFLLGSRNALILRVVFAAVYIIIRAIIDKNSEIWITLKMKIATIVMIPIVIMFLGVYNYTRSDQKVEVSNPLLLIVDFFYKQGTTFDTICQGFEYEDVLKNQPNVISYTFGDIIDYLVHNSISQKIFGTEDLGSGNSTIMLEKSNSLAHRLSSTVLGINVYLAGHGRGTSYIIETYMDMGMLGVAIYSLVLGIYLSSIISLVNKENFLLNYIVLTSLSQIFLLPRYSGSGFIAFIVTPQFWIVAGVILMPKLYMFIKEKYKENEG